MSPEITSARPYQWIGNIMLHVFVVISGFQVGAGAYEIFVTTPVWSGALPDSVRRWNSVADMAINPGLYWGKATPFYGLCCLALLAAAWTLPKVKRNMALFAAGVGLLIVIITINFFVPILMKTIVTHGAGLSGEEITQLADRWVFWNWFRFAAAGTSWLVAIRALSRPNN
ncbi:MAG: anthrone oxygenase family protein [Pyrinomonadaceae bacterium]